MKQLDPTATGSASLPFLYFLKTLSFRRLILMPAMMFAVFTAHAQFGTSPWTAPAGTYTVPTGVTSLTVTCYGGGGGGGGAYTSGYNDADGGGGGGGACSVTTFSVTPGQTITVVVGAAGTAGNTSGSNGGNGGTSSVSIGGTTYASAAGGNGGKGGGVSAAIGAGGTGGTTGTGTVHSGGNGGAGNYSGSYDWGGSGGGGGGTTTNGSAGASSGNPPAGGAGGATGGGTGGNGIRVTSSGSGTAGATYGGGGGAGAAYSTGYASAAGKAGGAGAVIISYTVVTCTTPSTQASSLSSSSIGQTTATITLGTRGSGNGVVIVAYPGASAGTAPASGTSYTGNAAYGSGTALGTGYVVYSGTGAAPINVNVTGLSVGTQYTFAAYEYNTTGTCYNTTSPPTNTFTTVPACISAGQTPANNATGICYTGTGAVSSISWTAVTNATGYDVYFGTAASPPLVSTNQAGVTYSTGTLAANTQYYWKVQPRNASGTATCATVYTFTTGSTPCYCTPSGSTSATTYINNFTTTGAQTNINNSSTYSTGGYGNYSSSVIAQATPGTTVNLSIGLSGVGSGVGVGVWVDWNQNGLFTDAGENVAYTTAYTTATTVTGSFTVPAGATTGTTRIRIIVNFNSPTPTSCVAASTARGEGEDYGLFICPAVTFSANPSTAAQTICKGGSLTALSVTASNATTYQWYQNSVASNSGGTAVTTGTGGTTSTYTPSASIGSAAYYYCVASSACASATSAVSGLITVTAPYTPSAITGTTTLCAGATTTLSSPGPSGGTISVTGTYPNSYIVQTFNASGSVVVPSGMTDLTAEALLVAGGGGGGSNGGGGGGGGGVKYVPSISLPAGTTAITVGSGGAAAASSTTTGSNGGNSSIGALATALGGGGGASRDGGPGGQNGGSGGGGAGAGTGSGTCSPGTFSGTRSDGGFYDVGSSGSVTINCMPAGATITNVHMDVSIGSGCSLGYYSLAYSYDDLDYYYYPGAECGGVFDETLWNGDGNGAVIYVAPFDEDGWTDNATISINSGTTVSYTYPLTTSTAGTGTSGQGSNGANGTAGDAGCNAAGGGGGGAGGAGTAASNNAAGNGGPGASYAITGTTTYYGGGGGGGTTNYTGCGGGTSWTNGTGGIGGGSNGESGTSGTAGLGGGGGAETAGGAGIIILRYPGGQWTSSNTAVATVDPLTGVVTGVAAGTATITYTVASGSCTNAISTTVTVNTPSTAVTGITGGGTVCQGTGVTLTATGGSLGTGASYQWGTGTVVGTNPIAGATASTYSATPSATTSYWVSVTGAAPCSGAGGTYTTVTVATPSGAVTGITGAGTICQGAGVTLTATGGTLGTGANYQWGTGTSVGSNTIAGATSSTYTVTPSGTTSYWVSVTGPSPCNGAGGTYTTVTVATPSTAVTGITGGGTVCQGAGVTLTATGGSLGTGANYQWGTGTIIGSNTIAGATSSTYTVTPSSTTSYWVSVTGPSPCNGAGGTYTTVTVVTPSSAVTGISGTTTICSGSGTTLTATGGSLGTGANYQWGTGTTIGANPIAGATSSTYSVTPASTSSYWVSVTGPSPCNGAGGVSATVTLVSATANAALATNSVNGVPLSEQCTDNNGWTYYADPSAPNNWLFGVYKNGNSFTPSVTLTVNSGPKETRNDALKKASYTLDRYWNVTISGSISPSLPVKVRFFYSPSDTVAMRAAAASRAAAYGLTGSSINGLEWFKTTAGIAFDPANNTYSDVPNKMLPSVTYGSLNGISYAEYQGLTSFSGGTAGMRLSPTGVALPVELMYLTATPVDNSYLRLDWATASEINNKGFEVQRSTDGLTYEAIGWIDGNGNSNTKIAYSYDDKTVIPNSIYYYRLRQVDIDGKEDYSNIVSGTIIGRNGFVVESLRPNPATDKVTVQVVSSTGQSATVSLTDALGRELQTREWQIYEGFNGIDLDLSAYAAGTYSVVVRSQNSYFTRKLVINK